MSTLDRVRNWTNSDGSIRTTYYIKSAMLKKGEISPRTGKRIEQDETEEDFIERVDETLRNSQPEYKNLQSTLDRLSDLPDMKERNKFRRGNDEKIFIDHSIKLESEKRGEKVKALQDKLKTLGLTQEEISLIVK